MKKNSYKDILIYIVVILAIMYLGNIGFYNETVMEILLVVALATFILFNFRNSIKRIFIKK